MADKGQAVDKVLGGSKALVEDIVVAVAGKRVVDTNRTTFYL